MPIRQITTKFFMFSQNNPGGRFKIVPKDGIGHFVVIEAMNADHANNLAIEKIASWGDRHEFSGSRWDRVHDTDGKDTPQLYGIDLYEVFQKELWVQDKVAYIHYFDGQVECVSGPTYVEGKS